MSDRYSPEEQAQLLRLARQTLEAITTGGARPHIEEADLTSALREDRACFVTLYIGEELRGCTGTLVARRCLADEVTITTVQTALSDPRFAPVTAAEVPRIRIEISVLTPPEALKFNSPDELIRLLRPDIDGVTLRLGHYRSTFLPQVWERVPDPVAFLTMLSRKMGLPGDAWRHPDLEVETYQTVVIEEPKADHARK